MNVEKRGMGSVVQTSQNEAIINNYFVELLSAQLDLEISGCGVILPAKYQKRLSIFSEEEEYGWQCSGMVLLAYQ